MVVAQWQGHDGGTNAASPGLVSAQGLDVAGFAADPDERRLIHR